MHRLDKRAFPKIPAYEGEFLIEKKTRLKTTGQPPQVENILPALVVLSFLDVSFFPSITAPIFKMLQRPVKLEFHKNVPANCAKSSRESRT